MSEAATHILISFCESLAEAPSLALFEIADGRTRVLRVPPELSALGGATGLAVTHRHVFVAARRAIQLSDAPLEDRMPSSLFVLDRRDLSLISRYTCASVFDVHSILARENAIDMVSTGSDEIVRLQLDEGAVIAETVVWRLEGDGPQVDSHHVNGICSWEGDVLVSGFGRKTGSLWSSASDGFLQRWSNGERIITGIHHPHSPTSLDDTVAFCESATETVRVMGSNRSEKLPGYPRGMCRVGNSLFVGTSKGRRTSKSTGVLTVRADPGVPAGGCSLVRLQLDDLHITQVIDLNFLAWEVYDLKPVTGVDLWPVMDDIEWRDNMLASLQASHDQRDATIAWLHTEVAQRDARNIVLYREVTERDETISRLHGEVATRDALIAQRSTGTS